MNTIAIKEIILSTKGELISLGKTSNVSNIAIDSREANSESLFIPIIGESLNGHVFAESAYKNGCRTFLKQTGEDLNLSNPDVTIIEVNDTELALGDIASYYKSQFEIPIVGITGSVGKTTTRDMVYSVLSYKFKTLKNERNFNNQIGVPLTLFNLNKEHECAVIEMGMSGFNEIEHLSNITRPHIGVISNIGQSHIERLGSQLGIFKAKMEICSNFNKDSILVVNGDDDSLKAIKKEKYNFKIKSFGFSDDCTIYCSKFKMDEDNIDFTCVINNEEYDFNIPVTGVHNIYNAMAAISVGLALDMSIEHIKEGLKKLEITGMRFEVEKTDKLTIINDTYNASPDSMKAALDSLSLYNGRKVSILGDMFEMGDYAEEGHKSVGSYAVGKTNKIITIGKLAKHIGDKAIEEGFCESDVHHFEIKEDTNLTNLIKTDDVVLVKASRGMRLETIVEELKNF